MASPSVPQPVSYPTEVEVTLKITFNCGDRGDQEYLQSIVGNPDPELTQLGFIADLFDVWNNNAQPFIEKINGLTHSDIKQRMLGKVL